MKSRMILNIWWKLLPRRLKQNKFDREADRINAIMAVDFADYFWGEKHDGFQVEYYICLDIYLAIE